MNRGNKNQIQKDQPSLISALYRSWQQYKVPAIFYHYTLSILSLKPKQQQITYMAKQIKLLQMGKHSYQIISDLITAREQSLKTITKNIGVFNTAHEEQIESFYPLNHQYDRQYCVVYQSRAKSKYGSRRFIQLINHIRIFRRVTIQVVLKIYEWMQQLYQNSYQGIIQYLQKNYDYCEKISNDTSEIITQYEVLFQKNPLLIMKKQHQKTEYALVYQYLRIEQQQSNKIRQILEIVKNHLAFIQKKRLEGIFKQSGSRKILRAVNKFEKIYCNFNKNSIIVNNYKNNYQGREVKANNFIINPENYKEISKNTLFFRKSVVRKQNKPKYIERSKSSAQIRSKENLQMNNIKKDNQENKSQKEYNLSFQFQTGIQKDRILSYLQNNIYKQKSLEQLQKIVRNIIKQKEKISFINIKSGNLLIAWMAAIFNPKDQLFRQVAEIIQLQLFMRVPNLHTQIVNLFATKGYGLIRQRGNVIYEENHIKNKVHSLISIEWRIQKRIKQDIKTLTKEYQCLKNSRILKYYTYSEHTKYHKYCLHKQTSCNITFDFEFVNKITIQGKVYFKVKCQKIEQIGSIWKITNNINNYHLVLAQNMEQILSYENSKGTLLQGQSKPAKIFQQKSFLCFPQTKNIKKYVNSAEKEVIIEKFNVSTQIFEILSITQDQTYIKNCLIIREKYLFAFVCSNQEDYAKTLAIGQLS